MRGLKHTTQKVFSLRGKPLLGNAQELKGRQGGRDIWDKKLSRIYSLSEVQAGWLDSVGITLLPHLSESPIILTSCNALHTFFSLQLLRNTLSVFHVRNPMKHNSTLSVSIICFLSGLCYTITPKDTIIACNTDDWKKIKSVCIRASATFLSRSDFIFLVLLCNRLKTESENQKLQHVGKFSGFKRFFFFFINLS